MNMSSNILKNLIELSLYFSRNLDWTQGAGGNSSAKDKDLMLVKASGYWLSEANKKNIFVEMSIPEIIRKIDSLQEDIGSAVVSGTDLKPSIEAMMHAFIPYKYVVHVHSINVLASVVTYNSEKYIAKFLDEIDYLYVRYARPGLPLAVEIKKNYIRNFQVIILENHGLIVAANSADEVIEIFSRIENSFNERKVDRSFLNNDIFLEKISLNSKYRLPKYRECRILADKTLSKQIISGNAIFPDQVVFLDDIQFKIVTVEKLEDELSSNDNEILLIKNLGILVPTKLSTNSELMLLTLSRVFERTDRNNKLRFLTPEDVRGLRNWDAEKYRKAIQKEVCK